MNSDNGKLFLSLQAQIAALADGADKKYFPYVDQDLGQLEYHNGDGRAPVSWPCVLIDIDDFDYVTNGDNDQSGKGRISLRLGFPPFSATGVNTPQLYKEKALGFYDLELVLHLALQGHHPGDIAGYTDLMEVFGSYDRIKAFTEKRQDFIRVRQLIYTLGQNDYSTVPAQSFRPVALNLTDNIN